MEVIVIGGGLSGLSAAARLVEAGRSVTLIEARDRLGGRLWSVPHEDIAIELGPEWIDGESSLAALLKESGATVIDSEGVFYDRSSTGWKVSRQQEVVKRLVRRLLRRGDPDRSVIEALHQSGRNDDLAVARQYLFPYVEGFHAADPNRLSSKWLVEVEEHQSADASEGRAPKGLRQVIERLAARIDGKATVALDTTVRRVRWRDGRVEVDTGTGSVHARCAVVTLPLGVLHAGAVEFSPPLTARNSALSQLAMGHAHKVVIEFAHAPWEDHVPDDALFLHDSSLVFPTWWRHVDANRSIIVGWVGGPQAEQLAEMDSPRIVGLAIESLARLLHLERAAVEKEVSHVWYHDWSRDPFTLGAYSYVLSGGIDAPEALARSVEKTLFFAGEATSSHGYNATMEGALQSGMRAAEEILARVQ